MPVLSPAPPFYSSPSRTSRTPRQGTPSTPRLQRCQAAIPPPPTPHTVLPLAVHNDVVLPTLVYPSEDIIDLALYTNVRTWYTVWVGFRVGVFAHWDNAHVCINRCPGNGFKGYTTFDQAREAYGVAWSDQKVKIQPWSLRRID
jgi:hypothetical protein